MESIVCVTCGAKILEKMSNAARSCCRLLIQPNVFLLERAISALQILYQTCFQGESGKEEKRKKQTPLKTFLQLHHIATSFSILFLIFLIVKKNGKNTFNNNFCSIKNALFNGILKVKFVYCFYTKM